MAGCPALDLFSQGQSEEEAKRSLEEAIGLWVEDCLERGTLDQALRELGFDRVHPGTTVSPGDKPIPAGAVSEDAVPAPATFPVHISIPTYRAAALLAS
ncbi:MAG TPA: hypothetical protein VEL74_17525 [Thermoanaerobaculia bacterium]|nr:hypothetical protein [Thermoanaerobaculia bacterium]